MSRNSWFKHHNDGRDSFDGEIMTRLWASRDTELIAFYWTLREMISRWESESNRGEVTLNLAIFKVKLGMNSQRSSKLLLKIAQTFDFKVEWNADESFKLFDPNWLELQETRGGKRSAKSEQTSSKTPTDLRSKNKEERIEEPPFPPEGENLGFGQAPPGQPSAFAENPPEPRSPPPVAAKRLGLNVSDEVFDREKLKACIAAWGATLKKFKIPKDPAFDEFHIAGLMRVHGFDKTKLALFGAGFEPEGETFDPANHCSIVRLRKTEVFEKFVNLGAKNSEESNTLSGENNAAWLAEKKKFDDEVLLLAERENLVMNDALEPSKGGMPEHVRAKQQGEISEEEYQRAHAFWVASHLFDYRPQFYPPISQSLREYIRGRSSKTVPYDSNASRELGDWLKACRSVHAENEITYEAVKAAIEQFEKNDLTDELESLKRFAVSFRRIADDYGDYNRGIKIQELDAKLRKATS